MSTLSVTFPGDVFRSLAPFVDINATGRSILILMPYDGLPVGLMIITSVIHVKRTDTMLVFLLAVEPPTEGKPLRLPILQYLIGEQVLQTPDGVKCFCVINDSNNTLEEFAVLYGRRYPHIAVDTIKTKT